MSNLDRRAFAASNRRLGVEFDLVVTAEDVGAYKPDLQGFLYMFSMLGTVRVYRARPLHVAESLYHDHIPAAAVDLDSGWIHRRHGRDGFGATAVPGTPATPLATFPSLSAFAARAAD